MKILIAIPSGEFIRTRCVQTFYEIIIPDGVTVDVRFITTYGVALARNKSAKMALDGGYEYLLYIDSDQVVPANILEVLLSHKKEIVAGWSLMRVNDQRTNIAVFNVEQRHYDFISVDAVPQGLVPVDAIGFSGVLIKTDIFRRMIYPYFRYVEYENGTVLSEDMYFCETARMYGFQIFCNTSLKLGHVKTIEI